MLRVILVLLLVVGIGSFAWWVQDLQISKWNLTAAVKTAAAKARTQDSVRAALEGDVSALKQDTARKARQVSDLKGTIGELKLSAQGAQLRYYQARAAQPQLSSQLVQHIASLDARQKKAAADELVEGIGPIATTVNDSVLNGQMALAKSVIKQTKTYSGGLEEANAQLSQQLEDERKKDQDLVSQLNGVKIVVVQKDSARVALKNYMVNKQQQTKGFFTKKKVKAALGDVIEKMTP